MTDQKQTPGHRWSGWPGAWCLDCGCDDPVEVALAEGRFDIDDNGDIIMDKSIVCAPCPEPGSKRHDPYARNEVSG